MYNIKIDEIEKIFYVSASGMISKDEGQELLDDLKNRIKKMNTSNYNLIVDSLEVKVSLPDSTEVLGKVLDIYAITPFRKKVYVVPESAITASQNKRMGGGGFYNEIISVTSYQKALDEIKK